MPDDVPGEATDLMIAFPVSWDLPFLPYFSDHAAFIEHANGTPATDDHPGKEGCEQCHRGAFHPEDFPPDVEESDLFCAIGLELHEKARVAIHGQHAASLRN
jgi:hypothetical protein